MSGKRDPESGGRRASLPSSSDISSPPFSRPATPSAQLNNSIIVNPSPAPPESELAVAPPPPPARKKPGRKPKNAVPEAAPTVAAVADNITKPKRVRKPRDPNAPPVQRRRKTKDAEENTNGPTEIKFSVDNGYRPPPVPATENSAPFQKAFATESEAIPNLTSKTPISFFNPHPPPPPPKPAPAPPPPQAVRTSGQNYDPIRSNYDPVRENVMSYNSYNPGNPQGSPGLPPSINRASASPSISSLVDPPNQPSASPSTATQSFFIHHQQARLQRDERPPSVPPSPTANRFAPPPAEPSPNLSPQVPSPALSKKAEPPAVNPSVPPTIAKKSMASGSTATSSAAASPKPPKLKDAKDTYPTPPPLPGSGLLQLGGLNDGTEFRAPTVIINIPMNGETNKYINFTRLAEDQYGWDAMHPRAAAQRDRLARVAVVSAALERNGSGKESGDEMSLDSEGEGSNVEMGGMSDGRTGTDGGPKKRKRKMKEDEYDKDDGFVDDSELLWEEQAAAAIDGFFVYSGPLVPEAEKPASETRADGAPKRGRGRGSRGGTSRSSGGRGGNAIGASSRAGVPLTGPGSRGGSTTRKPRMTKADRARMEQEKIEREKMGSMASMPGNYGGMPHLASAANLGNTPMVFNQ